MNIGQASRASGVSAKMIRYYETIGLFDPPPRSAAGYRRYTERQVHVLRFIRRARDLGFPLAAITDLLSLWQDRGRHSAEVKRLAQAHLDQLDTRIAELREMRDTLGTLIGCCSGDDRPDCPILSGLAEGVEAPPGSGAARAMVSQRPVPARRAG